MLGMSWPGGHKHTRAWAGTGEDSHVRFLSETWQGRTGSSLWSVPTAEPSALIPSSVMGLVMGLDTP